MVIDETADIAEAARNTRLSKTSDFGSGCSADGNLIVEASIYDQLRDALVAEGGHLMSPAEADALRAIYWDGEGHRTADTIAVSAQALAAKAGFEVAPDRRFLVVEQAEIGRHNPYSSEKLGVVLALFRYTGFDEALDMVRAVYEVGGKGHSCGIYSFDDDHIDRLARIAPVSRIMVRQPQSKANAGAFNNGMPMTSSLGCGTWGGNITSENIHLKHYMNVTWVSRPIAEDRPSEAELFGEFFGTPAG
jgi:sulfoacetaldehyde dehydrogenase